MRRYLVILALFLIVSCTNSRTPSKFISSPSGLLNFKVEINNNEEDKTKYECILLTVYDKRGNILTKTQTGASNYMKWAIEWHPRNDTIILNSRDVGISAYCLTEKHQLDTIAVTSEIKLIADSILANKYPNL